MGITRIIVAPNAFKGSLTAMDAARAIAAGLTQSRLPCKVTLFPVADGGDGTVPLLVAGMAGTLIPATAHDASGRRIDTHFGWVESRRTALVALSDASGLRWLEQRFRDPLHADTRGTGELIRAALDKGARSLLIGVGGSATVDGGSGLLRALGVRFLDPQGAEITDLPAGLQELERIDAEGLDARLPGCEILVLCDVRNPLLGPQGAAAVFGPQKGAGEREVVLLENILGRFSAAAGKMTGKKMDTLPSGGAAGGAAAALAVFAGAKLVPGIAYFLDALDFDHALEGADVVITGEGSLDTQTAEGKGPFGVACRAKLRGLPVVGMAGRVSDDSGVLAPYFDELLETSPPGASLEASMSSAAANLTRCAREWANRQTDAPDRL